MKLGVHVVSFDIEAGPRRSAPRWLVSDEPRRMLGRSRSLEASSPIQPPTRRP